MSFIKLLFSSILFLICFNTTLAKAENFKQNPDFIALESFLSSVKSLEGQAIQTFQGKSIISQFAIKLPAKMRVEYNKKGGKDIMIINGKTFIYYDSKLDQKTQTATPKAISLFFETSIFSLLNPNIEITSFTKNDAKFRIKFKTKAEDGSGIFEISNKIFQIDNKKYDAKFNF